MIRLRSSLGALALVLTLVSGARVASAEYIAIDDRPADPDRQLQPEGAVGFVVGEDAVGPVSGTAFGFHVDGGVRYRRLALLGEYHFLTLTENTPIRDPVHALVHRFGATLRYSFGVLTRHDLPIRGDFWIEAGFGRELIQWREGGRLARNDASAGLAGQLTVRFGPGHRRKLGLYYAAKFLIANRPDAKQLPPTCAGPCDEPTHMIPIDLGIFFNLGVVFGR